MDFRGRGSVRTDAPKKGRGGGRGHSRAHHQLSGGILVLDRNGSRSARAGQFVVAYLAYMNVFLATFNLMPALPLEGGRVLRSLLALRLSYLKWTRISAQISRVLAVTMGLLGFLMFNIFLMLLAFFVYMAVTGESQMAAVSEMLEGVKVRDLMTRKVETVAPDMKISDLLEKMLQERHLGYPVLDQWGRIVSMVTQEAIRGMTQSEEPGGAVVSAVMSEEINGVQEDTAAWRHFRP